MDIKSGNGYPSSALSNFAGHAFELDNVEIASMEGLLQALKFDKFHIQVEVCKLVGRAAKARGRARTAHWQRYQLLWWNRVAMNRKGDEYQLFLDRAYTALFTQNESFRSALKASGNSVLKHSIGHNNTALTVLTEREFCSRLHNLRTLL